MARITECCGANAFECPNLCKQIDSNSANDVANCIQNAAGTKEEDIKALICGGPNSFTLDELNILLDHLTETQLDGIQGIINTVTGDTLSNFTGDDGNTKFGRLVDFFTLESDNKHGNRARFTSVARVVPAVLAGRHFLNRNPATYSFGDLVEADGVTPVPGTTTLSLAKAAFGVLFDDWATGTMINISDTSFRALSTGSGWAFLSLIIIENGFSNWRVVNRNAMSNLINADFVRINGGMNWLPMNRGLVDMWTNTSSRLNTYYYYEGTDALITNFFGFPTTPLPSFYIRSNRNDP